MPPKSESDKTTQTDTTANPTATLEEAGLGKMMGPGTAWLESMAAMSAEVASFVAERLKEDVKTQHKILHCKNVSELQHIQAQFLQKAIDQYQEETGKLIEMSTGAFRRDDSDKT